MTLHKPEVMAQPVAEVSQPAPGWPLDLPHEHTVRCYWDVRECRWQCSGPGPLDG